MKKIIKVRLEENLAEEFREFIKKNDITQQSFLEKYILSAIQNAKNKKYIKIAVK